MKGQQYKLTIVLAILIVLLSQIITSCGDTAKFSSSKRCYYGFDTLKKAKKGDTIPANSIIKTSASYDSYAEIAIGSESQVKLLSSTTIRLISPDNIKLEGGVLLAKIKDRKGFRVETPYSSSAISRSKTSDTRTEFVVAHVGRESIFLVFIGNVAVSSKKGTKSIEVPEGYWVRVYGTDSISKPYRIPKQIKYIFGYK